MYQLHTSRIILICLLSLLIFAGVFIRLNHSINRRRLDTALIVAVRKDDTQAAQNLLAAGADPNSRDEGTAKPTLVTIVRKWIDTRRGRIYPGERHATALMLAAEREDAKMLEVLLAAHADTEARDRFGVTALAYATITNRDTGLNSLTILLNHHANVNAAGDSGVNALSGPVMSGFIEDVRLLLSRGADPNNCTDGDKSMLMWACGLQHENVVEALFEHNLDVNHKDHEGKTALMYALGNGCQNLLPFKQAIMRNHWVSMSGRIRWMQQVTAPDTTPTCKILNMLIQHGADVNTHDLKGKTALQQAKSLGFPELVTLLVRAGAH